MIRAALALACACALALSASAQSRRLAANGASPAAAPEAPAPYVDRVIEGLAPPEEDTRAAAYDATGWPRFLKLETRLGTQPLSSSKVQGGLGVAAAVETPSHGTISLDAAWSDQKDGSLATVRQRALPVGEGWFVNNEAGVITPLPPDVMRLPARIFVPTGVVLGASTEWRGPGSADARSLASPAILSASAGQFGRIQGYPTAGFKPLSGNLSTVGAQGQAGDWVFGARHAAAQDVSELDDPPPGTTRITGHSTQVTVRHAGERSAFQANLVSTRSNEVTGTKYGAWIDGEWRSGSNTHGWGLFRLDRDLKWAGQAMVNDIEGGYVRGAWHTRPWSANASLDVFRPVSGDDAVGVLVTASGQWRYSRTLSFGAGTTVRHYKGDAGSGYGEARWQHEWGRSGVRLEASRFDKDRSERLVYDHDWLSPVGWTVGGSVFGGRERVDGATGNLYGAALTVNAPLGNAATLVANVSSERRSRGDRYDNGNLTLSWQVAPKWFLDGNIYYNHGRLPVLAPIDPLAPIPRVTSTDTTAYFLVLRYEDHGGSRRTPLGGTAEGGAGRIAGIVFMDANRNGTREAGEAGIANATVYLDGKFATRTDAQGRFEFALVGPGPRLVSVLNETLPLPWQVVDRGEARITVQLRETTEVAIPVVRPD